MSGITKEILNQLHGCHVVSTVKQEEDEAAWLAVRTHGIGGSDVGAICGVSPFSTARQIYIKKTGQYDEPGSNPLSISDAARDRMHFGHMLEPIVANEFSLRTGYKLVDIDCTLAKDDEPWALANIDRMIMNEDGTIKGVLECKTTSEYMNDEWDSGEILESYIYQLNWYLWILGLDYGAFACLVGGNKFYYYEVFRNDELLQDMIPKAKSFWFDNVLKLTEPPMQSGDDELIKALYPATTAQAGSEMVLDEAAAHGLLTTIVDCKKKIKELEKIQKEAENRIKDMMQDTETAYTADFKVTWKPQIQKRVDTETLKMKFPDIYVQCTKDVMFKKMLVKAVN